MELREIRHPYGHFPAYLELPTGRDSPLSPLKWGDYYVFLCRICLDLVLERHSMTFMQLSDIFYSWGYKIQKDHYSAFQNYLKFMLEKKRVFIVQDESGIQAVVLFFLTYDFGRVYKKGTWDTIEDEPSGDQIYIDKMLARKWTPSIRRFVEKELFSAFPQAQEGYYHREPYDRCIRIRRKDEKILTTVP